MATVVTVHVVRQCSVLGKVSGASMVQKVVFIFFQIHIISEMVPKMRPFQREYSPFFEIVLNRLSARVGYFTNIDQQQ